MSSVSQIRTAMKTTLDSIAGLHVYDTVPAAPLLPCAVVSPAEASFEVAMGRGADMWAFDVLVLAQFADAEVGQNSLDSFVTGAGSTSIRQWIFQNSTLGLADVHAHVAGVSDYGAEFEAANVKHVGAVVRVVVHTSGLA